MAAEQTSSDYFERLLFPRIFQAFRIAIQPGKLTIALLAISVIVLSGWLIDLTSDVAVTRDGEGLVETELEIYLTDPTPEKSDVDEFRNEAGERAGLFTVLWHTGSDRFHNALLGLVDINPAEVVRSVGDCLGSIRWAFEHHILHAIILFAITLVSMSVAGGAICRIAALQLALGEKPGATEAIRYSLGKFPSYLGAPLAPMGIMLVLGGFIAIMGLLGNIPYAGEFLVGLGLVFSLGIGVLITVVMIGLMAGFSLMFPAVAYDGSDCFDSISRSFSYVYARPWRMGVYTLMAAVYGAICYLFVRFFALILLVVTRSFLELAIWSDSSSGEASKLAAIWPEPSYMNLLGESGVTSMSWSESAGGLIVHLWVLVVVGLVVSFVMSFCFTSQTIIYALLRKKVDHTAIDDVYTKDGEQGAELFDWDVEESAAEAGGKSEDESQATQGED